jgi:hypothetical protein
MAIALGACDLPAGAIDAPYPVNLHVDADATVVAIDAPGWYADTSGVFLCPTEPPGLPDPGDARIGWTPGRLCHDFGHHPSPGGLTIDLRLAELSADERALFAVAGDWYLLITDLDGDRVTGAVRSRFERPDGFAAS